VNQLRYASDDAFRTPFELLHQAAGAAAPSGPDVLDLSQGPEFGKVMRLPAPGASVENMSWASTSGLWDLRRTIAQNMSRDLRLERDPQHEILISAGATGALQLALATFVNPGEKVVVFDPTSPVFEISSAARGARIERIPCRVEEGKLRFGVDHVARCLRGARMMLLGNPTNPQGGVICEEDLEQIAWWAAKRDVLLFSDDSFSAIFHDQQPINLACLPRTFGRTLSAGSISKSHGQPGLRVGWLSADRKLLRLAVGVAAARAAFVPAVCQQAALSVLELPAEKLNKLREQLTSRRQYVFERLQTMGLQPEWPAGGHFFWLPKISQGMTGASWAESLFRQQRVRVSPGNLFGPAGTNSVRVSYALEDGRLRMALGKIAEFVSTQKAIRTRAA
jgi:aspartate/methionine/tyrosine aminotransferase